GMLPDQVPDEQRPEASGYYGLLQLIGTIVGFIVIGAVLLPGNHVHLAILSYAAVTAIAGALVVFGMPDVLTTRRDASPLGRAILLSFAIDVKRYRDFAWLMVSRLFFLMAPVGISSFSLNFIQDAFLLSRGAALHGRLQHRDRERRADRAPHPRSGDRRLQQRPQQRHRLPGDVRDGRGLLPAGPGDAAAGARGQGRTALARTTTGCACFGRG